MKIFIHAEAQTSDGDSENMQIEVCLPFMPRLGDNLKLHADGDYLTVADVFFDMPRARIDIYLVDSVLLLKVADLLAQGWVVEGASA